MNFQAGHRLAVLTGTTGLHVFLHAAAKEHRFTLVPMPMRDTPQAMQSHLAAARVDAIVADRSHAGLAQQICGPRPILVCDDQGDAISETGGELGAPGETDTYAVLQTSGTSGPPRLVDIPRVALAAHAEAAKNRLQAGPSSTWLACLPMWHIGGVALVHRCLHGGGRLLLQPEFHAAAALGSMQEQQVTHVSLVPTMLRRMLAVQAAPPDSLRCVLLGGDGTDPAMVRQALAAGWPVHVSYGLTEACSQVATATPDQLRDDPTTCGHPLAGVRIVIQDARGERMAPGQVGQIVVDGPSLAVPGPLHTGDLGHLDEAGRLFVAGRADDRITTGGEKVDPRRVEQVLKSHPGVADAAVVGIPDAEWGQRVVAAVAPAGSLDLESLQRHARARLAAHEVPKEIRCADIPRTPSGKLQRGRVRETWTER